MAESATAATIISRPSSLSPSEKTFTRGDEAATARKYLLRSSVRDSLPMVPGTYPRTLSGLGTVDDAGRWSTSSVVNFHFGSVGVSSRILAVYSASFGCTLACCADDVVEMTSTPAHRAASSTAGRRGIVAER